MAKVLLAILALTLLVGIVASWNQCDIVRDYFGRTSIRVGGECEEYWQCQFRICAANSPWGRVKVCQPENDHNYLDLLKEIFIIDL
ncbi:hypothetical protein KQX54_012140 [Cotesia glomerata]|uniref:Uncharacterized protein n=1 Tax=Cotesia glomerata TaxID=32391 RepID=A0AAV7ISB1_COTGL|nr:hypothetical protein KQX54_012140 [Cotesia glomerata]